MDYDDFNKWCDQWEKAQKKGIFKDAPKPIVPTPNYAEEDFFGNYRPPQESEIGEPDAEYWRQVYDRSQHPGTAPDVAEPEERIVGSGEEDEVLHEDTLDPYADDEDDSATDMPVRPKYNKKSLEDTADAIAKAANPIYHYSKGKDQQPRVTKNWSDGDELVELHKIKIQLEKLESKMNAADAVGESAQARKIQKQIAQMWEQIDKLSDSLTPDFVNDYLS
jgi:hypothetical protein